MKKIAVGYGFVPMALFPKASHARDSDRFGPVIKVVAKTCSQRTVQNLDENVKDVAVKIEREARMSGARMTPYTL